MGDQSFLVTLPSNSNMAEHPENDPGCYTVKLAAPIKLQGEWEVALVSMQYTHTWSNVDSDIRIRFLLVEDNLSDRDGYHEIIHFPPGATLEVSGKILEYAGKVARHQGLKTYLKTLPANVKLRHTYIYPRYFANANDLGQEVCRVFREAFPDTSVKLHYRYNHMKRRGRFLVNNGHVGIFSNDSRLGDLLGHSMSWVRCDNRQHSSSISNAEEIASFRTPNVNAAVEGETDLAKELTSGGPDGGGGGGGSSSSLSSTVAAEIGSIARARSARARGRSANLQQNVTQTETTFAVEEEEEEVKEEEEMGDEVETPAVNNDVTFRSVNNSRSGAHWYLLHMYSDRAPKIPRISSLWVYSDISQYQLVGNTQVPLLGIIPAEVDVGQRCHYCVNPVHFLGLRRNEISEIRIQICTDKGSPVPFASGDDDDNLVCCLRFRPRRSPLPI